MRTDDLNFHLPPELIAQEPAIERSTSRLLHYRRSDKSISHRVFAELPEILCRGDLLVLNDSRVLPARFMLQKETGGKVEGLFLAESDVGQWTVLLRDLGKARLPMKLRFERLAEISAIVADRLGGGEYRLMIDPPQSAAGLLEKIGRMPLPPYIHRNKSADARDAADRDRYQTVYADPAGSVAAPTAGLHFSSDLFHRLDAAGVRRSAITLHVGPGTFKPITAQRLEDHAMHAERYSISAAAAGALNQVKSAHGRIIAVGSTAARVLETQAEGAEFQARSGETSIFIYPPYLWKHVEGLITNFHLPRSTLIALAAAFVGLEEQRRIYQTAIENRYRFFSYGDAMLME